MAASRKCAQLMEVWRGKRRWRSLKGRYKSLFAREHGGWVGGGVSGSREAAVAAAVVRRT